jgi:type I restriction enzyme M protein
VLCERMKLAEILKDSNYKLSQFHPDEVAWLEQSIFTKETTKGETPYVTCLVRRKDIQLKPEEAIRQLYLKVLTSRYGYSTDRMVVEYGVKFGRETKKADIAIMDADRPTVPYIIVELKKPKEKDGKDQLKSYCNATGAPIGVWTNGDAISRWHRMDPNYFERITDIPKATQTLEDILQIKFTLQDLIENDRLVEERMSLRALIEEMEDEVLANAGVDVFEEVFKLIFTKLYDEWLSGQGNNRHTRILEFRNTGQTEGALKTKIQKLFDQAKEKWEGVFSEDSKISLTPSHLAVCVRSLENVKLFNSNLDVIDEAFEYLVNQSSKGEKGQYFTPRYVIDMCVKMLNPKEDEYMIDTAAGSSGFPVHTIFHVWRQILEDEGLTASHLFTMEDKPHRCYEYVQKRVFAIDFDEKSVRVARTLNLIAGDGQTNVLHLNTLDFDLWDETTKEEDWNDTYNEGFKRLKKLRTDKDSYKEFQFDVLMANPPFAGDIKEGRIIARYDLAKKPNGKWQNKVGRDILFIERNLDFLKPGGRMAIVLPQGRFNNSSDKQIRDYIAERCRILAVVGLHGNTFKPHTGTKTSVLFVQKWNDDLKVGPLCPRKEDYNIFFATMRKTGKDNSGEKIYRRIVPEDEEGLSETAKEKEFLLDPHDHLVVDHDLYNHDGMTEDGIAEAFIEFAKKENLSFF